ncbi:hypothetical protein [Saccharibacillus qingshengii]|uniref:hypothetical protein n=1 Tax=Saccharibacillus qingshengii TaxID=1763540 RepID=UPI0015535B66|nr:hypothetical protein [Saccharibacillus qingshengii]
MVESMGVVGEEIVVFGVDIGKDIPAWVKVNEDPTKHSLDSYILNRPDKRFLDNISFTNRNSATLDYTSGRDMKSLADAIFEELYVKGKPTNKKVALGFEAPMWTYKYDILARTRKSSDVFVERFTLEKTTPWYSSAGASVNTMAFSIGLELFSHLKAKTSKAVAIEGTVELEEWRDQKESPHKILLFEGFFPTAHKLPHTLIPTTGYQTVTNGEKHFWDAFLVAASYWERMVGKLGAASAFGKPPKNYLLVHDATQSPIKNGIKTDLLWKRIFDEVKLSINEGNGACDVVTIG